MTTHIEYLDRIISNWPKVSRRVKKTQIVFSKEEVNFCWLSPGNGMVQLRPCLGRKSRTRRLEYDGNQVRVVRQKTGSVDAIYQDPDRILVERFSYPGFMCSPTHREAALELIRQAYDQSEN